MVSNKTTIINQLHKPSLPSTSFTSWYIYPPPQPPPSSSPTFALQVNTQLRQSLTHIQMNGQIIRGQRLREIWQLLTIIHARVTRDSKRHDTVLVPARVAADQADDAGLVDVGEHGDGVVARFEGEIVEVGVAHELAVNGEVEGDVALICWVSFSFYGWGGLGG